MTKLSLEFFKEFEAALKRDGSDLPKELEAVTTFRTVMQNIEDVQISTTINLTSIAALVSVLPPAHGQKLIELCSKKPPIGTGMRGIKEIIDDLARGSEEFIKTTIRILSEGSVSQAEGAGLDFEVAIIQENMLRWVLIQRLAEERERIMQLGKMFNI